MMARIQNVLIHRRNKKFPVRIGLMLCGCALSRTANTALYLRAPSQPPSRIFFFSGQFFDSVRALDGTVDTALVTMSDDMDDAEQPDSSITPHLQAAMTAGSYESYGSPFVEYAIAQGWTGERYIIAISKDKPLQTAQFLAQHGVFPVCSSDNVSKYLKDELIFAAMRLRHMKVCSLGSPSNLSQYPALGFKASEIFENKEGRTDIVGAMIHNSRSPICARTHAHARSHARIYTLICFLLQSLVIWQMGADATWEGR
jgi:hypothetical protein